MKRLAIIGGLSLMTVSGGNMMWNNQQRNESQYFML